jgi:hypothetical protein
MCPAQVFTKGVTPYKSSVTVITNGLAITPKMRPARLIPGGPLTNGDNKYGAVRRRHLAGPL